MDAEKPSFVIDNLEELEQNHKPLPYRPRKRRSERISNPDTYMKFDESFYDDVKSCAEYIERLESVNEKIKYSKRLNKIFLLKHRGSALRLFKELWDKTLRIQ